MISPFYLITYNSCPEEQVQLWKEMQETPHKGIPSVFSVCHKNGLSTLKSLGPQVKQT